MKRAQYKLVRGRVMVGGYYHGLEMALVMRSRIGERMAREEGREVKLRLYVSTDGGRTWQETHAA